MKQAKEDLERNKEQGRARTSGDVEEERVGGRGQVLPDGTRQSST